MVISKIESGWLGLRPHLKAERVVVQDWAGVPTLTFDRVDATLSWYSLLVAELRLHRLEITRPRFELKREPNGLIYLNGFTKAINAPTSAQGFRDWLLRQESIQLNHAVLEWRDNLRGAPPLLLKDVGLRLVNSGKRHRFGLVAAAPEALASGFDLRGDFQGSSVEHFGQWSGTLYADLGATDIAAWGAWVDLPYHVSQGSGVMRGWAEIKQGRPVALSAQVQLQKVRTRLGLKLPELDVARLSGHLGWRELPQGFIFESKRIDLDAGVGRRFTTQNLFARYEAVAGKRPEQGEFRADNIDIAALVALSEYLPLSDMQRNQLEEASPQGVFKRLALKWTGAVQAPQEYKIKGVFSGLGIRALGKLPGFSNVSGEVEADPKGGSLKITGKEAQLDMPLVFRQALQFDEMNVAATWRINAQRLQLLIDRAVFANAHLRGSVTGTYETLSGGLGTVDFDGQLTRATAAAVRHYLPRVGTEQTYQWLQGAVLQGSSDNVRLKLKGRLDKFPFANSRDGVFRVTAKVKDGILQYAPDWPRIEQIQANLDFNGPRMNIDGAQGTIFNTRIVQAKIAIADLAHHDPVLEVDGETQGPTPDQLRFIEESPLRQILDGLTTPMRAEGQGKLALSLRLPLERLQEVRSAGHYQFQANKIWLAANAPVLDQASGKLEFTEHGIVIPKVTAQLFGGPVAINSRTTPEGVVRVGVTGRLNTDGLQRAYPSAFTQRLKGSADWSASIALRKRAVNLVLVSNLAGLASELPYPLGKTAAENLPLKIERRILDVGQDLLSLNLGKQISAQLQRDITNATPKFVKGRINFSGADATPTQAGVWVEGELEKLDADLWRSLLYSSKDEPPVLPLSGIQMQVKTLDFLGHRFNNFKLNALSKQDSWQASLGSDEMQGDVNWRQREGGRMVARFQRLIFPEAAPPRGVQAAGGHDLELPALDIVIDDLQLQKINLGKLEWLANKQGNDWRIERLRISNPEASFNADGVWQSWLAQPQTKLNIDLDVKDVGKFLARMGYPDRIRGGVAKLNGGLSWHGGPQDFNLASLGGDFTLDTRRGQFMKVNPGVGKLLGLLSLQALPRRLSLDFRDVFSDGFAFDTILGVMSVKQGVVSTEDFVMQGPAAVVTMAGTANLTQETQNLRVKIVPVVGDGISLLAFLGGPVAGIGTFVLQKLFKDPLGRIAAYDYAVTGTWENPVVVKVGSKTKETTP